MTEPYHKIRLPPWNPRKPNLWFKQCEDIFKLSGVKEMEQEAKAILIGRELPAAVTDTIEDLILNPTAETQYDDLKAAVQTQHQQSPEEAFVNIKSMTLGDRKPSALGQAMLAAIPSKCAGDKTAEGCGHKKW